MAPTTRAAPPPPRSLPLHIGRMNDDEVHRAMQDEANGGGGENGLGASYPLQQWDDQIACLWRQQHGIGEDDVAAANNAPDEDGMWKAFLWDYPPAGEIHASVLLNASQMAGLAIARLRAVLYEDHMASLPDYLGQGEACVYEHPIPHYTLRHLRDTVQNLQLLWASHRLDEYPNIRLAVDALFHRFGVLASMAFTMTVLNDQDSIEARRCTLPIFTVANSTRLSPHSHCCKTNPVTKQHVPTNSSNRIHISWLHVRKLPTSDIWNMRSGKGRVCPYPYGPCS